jgi:hypothetical protein
LLTAVLLGAPEPAWSQAVQTSHPAYRMDVSGSIGWLNADKSDLGEYTGWYNRSVYGGGTVGWYWTHHLKTEVETGASSEAQVRVYDFERLDNNAALSRESEYDFSTRRVAIGQIYQFYRNAAFHPYVGIGLDLTWERTEQTDEPAILSQPPRPVEIQPARVHPPQTDLLVRPFVSLGFKAYMTPRGFFRSDLKLGVDGGVDEVQLRFGFGVDF